MDETTTTAENSALVVEESSQPIVLAVEKISAVEDNPDLLCVRSIDGDLVYINASHFLPVYYFVCTDDLGILHPEAKFSFNANQIKVGWGLILACYHESSDFASAFFVHPDLEDVYFPNLSLKTVRMKEERVNLIFRHSREVAEKRSKSKERSN